MKRLSSFALIAMITMTIGPAAQQAESARVESKPKTAHTSTPGKHTHKISSAEAVAIVKRRKDVKEFFAQFPGGKSKATGGGYPVIDVEPLEKNWNVHVYEQTPDHTATMDWFEVNSQTGAVKSMND